MAVGARSAVQHLALQPEHFQQQGGRQLPLGKVGEQQRELFHVVFGAQHMPLHQLDLERRVQLGPERHRAPRRYCAADGLPRRLWGRSEGVRLPRWLPTLPASRSNPATAWADGYAASISVLCPLCTNWQF